MTKEFNEMTLEVVSYLVETYLAIKPFITYMMSFLMYILFPTEIYLTWATVIGIVFVLNIFTKIHAIAVNNGGFLEAIKSKKLTSLEIWNEAKKRIVSYLVVMILAGLSYRFGILGEIMTFFGSIIYTLMFLRESHSVIENMIDAGYNLNWILPIIKRKQRQILDNEGITEEENEEGGKDDGKQGKKPF